MRFLLATGGSKFSNQAWPDQEPQCLQSEQDLGDRLPQHAADG